MDEVVEIVQEEPAKVTAEQLNAPIKSGLASIMSQYLPKEEVKEDVKEIKEEKQVEKPKEDESKLFNNDLTKMKPEELVEEVKRKDKLSTERHNQILEMQKKIEEMEKAGVNPKTQEFIDGLKKDLVGTWNKYAGEFNLPDTKYVKELLASKDNSSRLSQWQKNDLIPQVEKKFGLVDGQFEYDSAEAYKAGTPSYEFRKATENKEKELDGEFENAKKSEKEIYVKAINRQTEDSKWLTEKYFDNDAKKTLEYINRLNELPSKIQNKELDESNHPFELRNLIRGAFHDEFVKIAVDKAVSDLKSQYDKVGLYLPNKKETPTDVTSVKGKSVTEEAVSKTYSPLSNALNSYKN